MLINSSNLDLVSKGFQEVFSGAFEATPSHIGTIAMNVTSTAAEENYAWLGQFPELREWVGDRVVKNLHAHGFTIKNKKFESTASVERDDVADDKYGIYKPMFSEMGRTTKLHPDKIAFSLLKSGFTTTCYDGQPFFGTRSAEIDGTVQQFSNVQEGEGPAWFLLDASRGVKPLVWQEREGYEFQSLNDLTDKRVFMTDTFLYGIRARVNCGFGLWQLAFGSRKPLTAANYAAARAAMCALTGDQGHILGITPTHLIAPPSLEEAARTLLLGENCKGTSNIWAKSAELIVTPHVA